MITVERLRDILAYDQASGVFTWLRAPSRGKSYVGHTAGNLTSEGRINITIDGRRYKAHRLAWLYVHGEWPLGLLDHIDGNPANNRLANLRLATQSQNCANARRRVDNSSGFKGVHFDRLTGRWRAEIMAGGRRGRLGRFDSPEAAHAAYAAAASRLFGEYARVA